MARARGGRRAGRAPLEMRMAVRKAYRRVMATALVLVAGVSLWAGEQTLSESIQQARSSAALAFPVHRRARELLSSHGAGDGSGGGGGGGGGGGWRGKGPVRQR